MRASLLVRTNRFISQPLSTFDLERNTFLRYTTESYYGMSIDRSSMNVVTVSPKYQVVIPQAIRESLEIKPGQKIQAILFNN